MNAAPQPAAEDSAFHGTRYCCSFAGQVVATFAEAFGEEIGQNSCLTTDERRSFLTCRRRRRVTL